MYTDRAAVETELVGDVADEWRKTEQGWKDAGAAWKRTTYVIIGCAVFAVWWDSQKKKRR